MSNLKHILSFISLEQKVELSNHIYISKNTVSISNIPDELYSKNLLYQKKYLGQYGHINQIFFDKNYKKEKSLIVIFDTINQAALAILSLDNFKVDRGYKIKTMYYITKYCHYFLNNKKCPNYNCLYLHNISINEYHYQRIKNYKKFNSFQFALDILDIPKNDFEAIKEKKIGNNYYEKQKKFPKFKIKELKNNEYDIQNQLLNTNVNNQTQNIKTKNNNANELFKLSSEDDSANTNDSSNNKSYSLKRKIRRKKSRFEFVKNGNENCISSVVIPEIVLDFLDKSTNLLINKYENYSDKNLINFNDSWSNILFNKNICKEYLNNLSNENN
jgi:hypothetical protein